MTSHPQLIYLYFNVCRLARFHDRNDAKVRYGTSASFWHWGSGDLPRPALALALALILSTTWYMSTGSIILHSLTLTLFQEENDNNKQRAAVAQEKAAACKAKFDAERTLRRALNAKVLDMQVGEMQQVAVGLTSLAALGMFSVRFTLLLEEQSMTSPYDTTGLFDNNVPPISWILLFCRVVSCRVRGAYGCCAACGLCSKRR